MKNAECRVEVPRHATASLDLRAEAPVQSASSSVSHSRRHRPPSRDRLLPLLFRYASAALYRRSPRFAEHRARVGDRNVLPAVPLADLLAAWMSQNLPDRLAARLGVTGLLRGARLIVALLRPVAAGGGLGLAIAGAGWRLLRWMRNWLRFLLARPRERGCFDRRPPVGPVSVPLGGVVRLRGFRYADNRLTCWFERIRPYFNRCQIFVHLYPADGASVEGVELEHGRISRDRDPRVPVGRWPRRWAYREEIALEDVPPGDYRVEVGLFDVPARQRLVSEECGSSVDLGWIRIEGAGRRNAE